MKRIMAGLIGGMVFGVMISGTAFASGDEGYEGYEHRGYRYNDDMYEYGRARIAMPTYGNVLPTAPVAVYSPTNVSNYRAAVPYYGHEGYEHSGRYGYDDDRYEYRGGYYGHE